MSKEDYLQFGQIFRTYCSSHFSILSFHKKKKLREERIAGQFSNALVWQCFVRCEMCPRGFGSSRKGIYASCNYRLRKEKLELIKRTEKSFSLLRCECDIPCSIEVYLRNAIRFKQPSLANHPGRFYSRPPWSSYIPVDQTARCWERSSSGCVDYAVSGRQLARWCDSALWGLRDPSPNPVSSSMSTCMYLCTVQHTHQQWWSTSRSVSFVTATSVFIALCHFAVVIKIAFGKART